MVAASEVDRGPRRRSGYGVLPGTLTGLLVTFAALLLLTGPAGDGTAPKLDEIGRWLEVNLGHSLWLFAAVLVAFAHSLTALRASLERVTGLDDAAALGAASRSIARLDQLSEVWIHLFVGIGVIWTAIGMRAALQAALGDPEGALSASADSVLQRLVDGGILLALTTTIVGGIGSYLMRLGKTLLLGAELQGYYRALLGADVKALRATLARIEQRLALPPRQDTPPC